MLIAHRNGLLHVFLIEQRVIDPQDDPVEQGAVQRLGHGVPRRDRLKKPQAFRHKTSGSCD